MMRQLIIWMIMMLQYSIGARYPECIRVPCPNGAIPLSPLSYNTVRSNVFNGTQPSNEGCTNGAMLSGQVIIDCGQGTTLIDCDRGIALSNLSDTFAWNRTSSVAEQVSIAFRFDQLINISRIALFVFNSPSNSIIIPDVSLYWSNDDSITPSNEINITPDVPRRDRSGLRRLDIDVNDNGLRFQYLRIEMSFYMDSEWILLSEVEFCGDVAPYSITQPLTDNSEKIVTTFATMATLICSLNVTIPSTVTVTWLHNGSVVMTIPPNGNTTALMIQSLQPSDAGVYQCVFNDTAGYVLRRSTNLFIVDVRIIQPPVNFINVTFNELTSSVQLTCSLNIDIPSGVTVTWLFRGVAIIIEPPLEVITVDNSTSLVIHNPQPSDHVGAYQCLFNGLDLQRRPVITLEYVNTTIISNSSVTPSSTVTSSPLPTTSTTIATTESMPTATTETSNMSPIPSPNITTKTDNSSSINLSTIIISSTSLTSTTTAVTTTTTSTPVIIVGSGNGDSGGANVGAIVAPIIIIIILVIVIIVLVIGFLVWRRKQKHVIAHTDSYNGSVTETKLRSLTVTSDTLSSRFGGPLNSDSTRSTAPIYSVPRRNSSSKKELKPVEKTLSTLDNSPPVIPDRTSKYDECVENKLYDKPVNGITEIEEDSIDDELLDDSFDEDDSLTPIHRAKKGVSPRRGKSKSPSKTPVKKAKQPSSSSTQSSLLSPFKSFGSHSSGVDSISIEGDKTLKGIHSSMQPNPLYASSQSLSKDDKNIELNIYDSIQSPKHDNLNFTESIYSEIAEPNTPITTENPKVGSVKDAKDLYPYSSIYAEPLPLDKSESPPLISPANLTEVKLLGTGQFGEVVLANTVGLSKFYLQLGASEDCSVSFKVAVKKLKLSSTKEMQQAFEKEIKFMSRLKDDNVIRLLGICTTGTPFIMMEYMENGDLNQYLHNYELLLDPDEAPSEHQITPVTLIFMAYQIASGMKYLSSLKYVHRDLATRNILVGRDYVVKIADFGMSQNLYSAYYFKVKGRAILPIRWMAYECFFGKFSVKTDVWAFGITLWEIFTLAKQQPYHDKEDQAVIDNALKGKDRLLMSKPEDCPDEIYEVMLRCWVHDPTKRATFAELYDTLKEINNRQ